LVIRQNDPKPRYQRQIRLPFWGDNGQNCLAQAHAVIVGCGALGTLQAEALVRAGLGHLTLIDRDFVELSNLHRQFLFTEQDAADSLPKAIAAARQLRAINSEVEVQPEVADLEPGNIQDLCAGASLILDATDNFETRYLINDYSVATNTPWIYGGAVGTYGISATFLPGAGACFRCIYPEPPEGIQPTCETAGVLSAVTMLIATLQISEALKLFSGNSSALRKTIYTADIWTNRTRESPFPARDADCPACGQRNFEWLNGEHRAPVSLCGRNAVQIHEARAVNLAELSRALAPLGLVRYNEFALRFFTEPYELTVFPDGRAIIKGTTDPGVARSVYARYLGQ
jgi:molybdopterin/thiamine biosynthesis adenylyltransferase